jgi:hypothetical protein
MLRPESCEIVKGFSPEQQVRRHFHLLHHGRSTNSVGMWGHPPAIRETATGIFLWAAWSLYDAVKGNEFKHIEFSHE